VLFISHDRELLVRVATRIATLEPNSAGATLWVHPGSFTTYDQARQDRNERLEELLRRWDEEHAKLKDLVRHVQGRRPPTTTAWPQTAGRRDPAAKFEEAGPPEAVPVRQNVRMRLTGGRTAKRAVVCDRGLSSKHRRRRGGSS
jgi:ATPase subunit of ABC transporter with duplicated ATPase domains